MRLAVIIPAYNEERTIGAVIRSIPTHMFGISKVDIIVIDDGSTDRTADVARSNGTIVYSLKQNRGLSVAFRTGLEIALKRRADIIVNTDADNQYDQSEIPLLIKPIMEGRADIVLTDRRVWRLPHMPLQKKIGNSVATLVTRFVSWFPVKDAQSGFRAFSKDAALRLNVLGDYTYVQETIIQAVSKRMKIVQVPCSFKKRTGKSKLIKNIFNYAGKAGVIIIRTYLNYKPFRTFFMIGSLIFLIGLGFGMKVIIHFIRTGMVTPYLPTAVLTAVITIIGFQVIVVGLLADLMGTSRKVQEEILYKIKKNGGL